MGDGALRTLGLVQQQLDRVVLHERRRESNSFASLATQQTAKSLTKQLCCFCTGPCPTGS